MQSDSGKLKCITLIRRLRGWHLARQLKVVKTYIGNSDVLKLRLFRRRLLKSNGAMRVRRPVRADVHTVLCRFFQIEEHATPENTEERGAAETREDPFYEDWACRELVVQR